jgi:tRNA(fMet)-specific endonuclease VapC
VTPILIDTNAYAAVHRGDANAEAIVLRSPRIGVSIVVLGEILAGIRAGTRQRQNRDELSRFLASRRVELLLLDEPIAERYANIMAQLRAAGKPIPTNDIWIAASALEHGFAVYSYDRHFQVVPGLQVVTKPADLDEDQRH